jgi:hypothetical protein
MVLALLLCGGRLVFAILMAWFEWEFVFYLVYLFPFVFSCIFLIFNYVILASLVKLAFIRSIMLNIVLG